MESSSYKGLDLIYVLPGLLGEHIISLLNRCMAAGGLSRMKDLATTLVDRRTIQPPWTLPSHLNRLAEKLTPVFESGEAILRAHTCLPAYLPFVTKENVARVLDHALNGVSHRGLSSAIGIGGSFAESKPAMRICPVCVREDELKHGFAYWRRVHALAGVTFCAHHGRPLMTGCGSCRYSQVGTREPLLPQRTCWCGESLKPVTEDLPARDRHVLTQVARLGSALLDGALDGRTADDVGAYFQYAAFEAGYRAGTRIRSPALSTDIASAYSESVQSMLNARLGGKNLWAQRIFGLGQTDSVLGRNLLLFHFFGERLPTSEDFANSQEHRRRMDASRSSPTDPEREHKAEKMADRHKIARYLAEHPQASRTEVLKALGRVVMRARERDSEWYDQVLPAKARGGVPDSAAKRAKYLSEYDERASAHIELRRRELLLHPGLYPKAITRTALLKGLPSGNSLNASLLSMLPKTSDALARAIESREQFQRRFAALILNQYGPSSLAERMAEAYRRTGLSPSELEQINFGLLKEEVWPSQRQSNGS